MKYSGLVHLFKIKFTVAVAPIDGFDALIIAFSLKFSVSYHNINSPKSLQTGAETFPWHVTFFGPNVQLYYLISFTTRQNAATHISVLNVWSARTIILITVSLITLRFNKNLHIIKTTYKTRKND